VPAQIGFAVAIVFVATIALGLFANAIGVGNTDSHTSADVATVPTSQTAIPMTVPATTSTQPTTTTLAPTTTTARKPPNAPAPTTTPPAPTTPAPSANRLIPLAIAPASRAQTYQRDQFGSGWIDADGDCQNTRAEVLSSESQVTVTFTSSRNCTVATGRWVDPWSGTVTTIASKLQIDHMVPLANAWRSGAWNWSMATRVAYANDLTDPGHLNALVASENEEKSDDGPEAWRPPLRSSWCRYALDWNRIKARWHLTATSAEWTALEQMAATC
jgi:hypothetical protein